VATLHPGGFWYAVPDAEAARRIAVEHLKNGRPVADLLFREGGR
jgi:(2Fe-2S) ferredoxin